MAKIKTIRPIESISGKLKKTDAVGFALRNATKKNFTVTKDNWKMPIERIDPAKRADVQAQRTKFRTVAGLAHERMTDPAKRQMDYAAFKAQTKYTTFFGYLFHLEWESYEG